MILEMGEQRIEQCCVKKLESEHYGHLKDKQRLAHNHALEYLLNLKQVKEIYANQYFSVDGEKNHNHELEDMAVRFTLYSPLASPEIQAAQQGAYASSAHSNHWAPGFGPLDACQVSLEEIRLCLRFDAGADRKFDQQEGSKREGSVRKDEQRRAG